MNARQSRTLLVALAMLAPNFIGFVIFTAGPVVFSFFMAFTNWDLTLHNNFSHQHVLFVGLDNFKSILGGEEWRYFSSYFANTVYLMMVIPVEIALSLIAALMLSSNVESFAGDNKLRSFGIVAVFTLIGAVFMGLAGVSHFAIFMVVVTGVVVILGLVLGQTSFRTLFYLPFLTSGVATFILWKALYRPEHGPINNALAPALNGLSAAVRHSSPIVWQAAGWLVIVGAAALMVWFLSSIIERLRYKDVGVNGFAFSVLGMALLLTAIAAVGWVIVQLPHRIALEGTLDAPKWLVSTVWSKPALMLMTMFMALGSNNMLLYLAALNNVPRNLYEAAAIDGATKWQSFWSITWPQLAPTTFFIVIMSTIGGLQGGFDQARVMTLGGPAGSTTTLSYYLYQRGFTDFKLGLASAIAWTMFAMIFMLTIFNWRYGNKMVND